MATTTNYSWNLPTVGGSTDAWGNLLNANWTALDTLLGGVSATELAILDGATVTTAELNILDGVTASAAEINVLDGITATVTELNYTDGVTSNIQTQLDAKQNIDATLTAYSGTLTAANKIPYATATDTAGELDFKDEDDMASNSAIAVPSQQSVKAYVDSEISGIPGGIGISQTWQDVAASRSSLVTYQNTTGKPIMVSCRIAIASGNLPGGEVSVDGTNWVTVAWCGAAESMNISFIVPNNWYYRARASGYWAELR